MPELLSVIITAKDREDPKLKDLLWSIEQQTFRNYEIIIETRGNSESAKGIALKRARGRIICILASDNYLNDPMFFAKCMCPFQDITVVGAYPIYYWYYRDDDILNRYFALFGFNDPVPFYLEKADKFSYYPRSPKESLAFVGDIYYVRTLGDNGFFIRRNILMQADIEHYFHIDVCQDLFDKGYKKYALVNTSIWHRTGGNIFKFFKKRLFYADKFASGRRWHMVTEKDIPNLLWFIFCSLTLVQPLYLSVRGYKVIKDKAWFLHPLICLITVGVYGIWVIRKSVSSFAVLKDQ